MIVATGSYIDEGFDDSRLVAHHVVSANALLMDAVTRMDEMRYFREKIPSSDHVPCRLTNAAPPPRLRLPSGGK